MPVLDYQPPPEFRQLARSDLRKGAAAWSVLVGLLLILFTWSASGAMPLILAAGPVGLVAALLNEFVSLSKWVS